MNISTSLLRCYTGYSMMCTMYIFTFFIYFRIPPNKFQISTVQCTDPVWAQKSE